MRTCGGSFGPCERLLAIAIRIDDTGTNEGDCYSYSTRPEVRELRAFELSNRTLKVKVNLSFPLLMMFCKKVFRRFIK